MDSSIPRFLGPAAGCHHLVKSNGAERRIRGSKLHLLYLVSTCTWISLQNINDRWRIKGWQWNTKFILSLLSAKSFCATVSRRLNIMGNLWNYHGDRSLKIPYVSLTVKGIQNKAGNSCSTSWSILIISSIRVSNYSISVSLHWVWKALSVNVHKAD